MAGKQRKRISETSQNIRKAVGRIFSAADFSTNEFALSTDVDAQLSLTGDVAAYGNGGGFDGENSIVTLASVLGEMLTTSLDTELLRYAEKKKFFVLCGKYDRSAAIAAAVGEMISCGVYKMIIAADTLGERENISESLRLMRASIGNAEIYLYRGDYYDRYEQANAAETVYEFLLCDTPAILIIGRDSFSRGNNLIFRVTDEYTLAEKIAMAHPVLITSSYTVNSGRTMAKNGRIFSPVATVIFTEEIRRLKEAVIYKPKSAYSPEAAAASDSDPAQLAF